MPAAHALPLCLLFCLGLPLGAAPAETLTLPAEKRPAWLRREGMVMAGSWEPLFCRVRRNSPGFEPTAAQRAAYHREHSPEMVARLKQMGVNFVMMHCYKGAGMAAERQSMADAVRFAHLCHQAGLHVGVYAYSGTVLPEMFAKEVPQVADWLLRDPQGNTLPYPNKPYRSFVDRNHPEAQAYLRRVVRFAVEDIHADLLHLDNYSVGPQWDKNSVERFRRYLGQRFTPRQRALMGTEGLARIQPPSPGSPELLARAWRDFSCDSLAESYYAMTRYARSLRPDILMELNPGGVYGRLIPPVDHGRLLLGGEAFWDEERDSGYAHGQIRSRIRSYKVARRMGNMAFTYVATPLEMAESMAFNLDCLGAICQFEYGNIVAQEGRTAPPSPQVAPWVRFYRQRHDLFRDAAVVADVAVLRNFPSMAFAPPATADLAGRVEQVLIDNRQCFQIVYDRHLDDLGRYRALVLPGCAALSDEQVAAIRRYVCAGGRICAIGPLATLDTWMLPRKRPALDDLPPQRVVRLGLGDDWLAGIHRACPASSAAIAGPHGLCCELTEQPGRRLLHLVNYRADKPAERVAVRLEIPAARRVRAVTLASPEQNEDRPLAFEQHSGSVFFTVPHVRTYQIAVVTTDDVARDASAPLSGHAAQEQVAGPRSCGAAKVFRLPITSAARQNP